jgi:hypothetical protein
MTPATLAKYLLQGRQAIREIAGFGLVWLAERGWRREEQSFGSAASFRTSPAGPSPVR